MENGYLRKEMRVKQGAYETIDNVTKFALDESDWEEVEEWVEYTPDEVEEIAAREEAAAKKAEQEAFLSDAPVRMANIESCLDALTSAFGEVE